MSMQMCRVCVRGAAVGCVTGLGWTALLGSASETRCFRDDCTFTFALFLLFFLLSSLLFFLPELRNRNHRKTKRHRHAIVCHNRDCFQATYRSHFQETQLAPPSGYVMMRVVKTEPGLKKIRSRDRMQTFSSSASNKRC